MTRIENKTLEKILNEAMLEFMEKGYQKASLREIVRRAGVTTGAFYGYFKNKEKLFDALVEKQYNKMLHMYNETLNEFFSVSPEEQYNNMGDMTFKCMKKMKEYMYENFDAFKLILCCSEGTKYKDMIHNMANMDVQATHDFADNINQLGTDIKKINPVLEHILTSGMFTGFFELIVHDVSKEEADEYIKQLLDFYTAGWEKIMGF